MNILFLSEIFYPNGGGAEFATYLYSNHLNISGFDVAVLTNRFAEEPQFSRHKNLKIVRLPLFKGTDSFKYSILKRFDVLFSSYMRKMIKWADVVYIPRYWYSAIPLAKAYRKPVIIHLHDYIPICPLSNTYDMTQKTICNRKNLLCPPRCIYAYEKSQGRGFTEALTSVALNSTFGRYFGKFVNFSDAVICVSKVQRDMITKYAPSLRNKTHVIYNPIPELSSPEIENDDFGYFGGPNRLKGFNTLYQAMKRLKQINGEPTRVQATKFSNSSQLFESLRSLGFSLHGKLNEDQYEKLYGQIRAVLVPSVWQEPWPYVVIEAILRGRFVVASRIGGIPEQVKGCEGVSLFEPGNPKMLAEAIEFTKNLTRENITELGLQSRETFLKRFDNETAIERFTSICERLT